MITELKSCTIHSAFNGEFYNQQIWYKSEYGRFVQIIGLCKTRWKILQCHDHVKCDYFDSSFQFHTMNFLRKLWKGESQRSQTRTFIKGCGVKIPSIHQFRIALNEHQHQSKDSWRSINSLGIKVIGRAMKT